MFYYSTTKTTRKNLLRHPSPPGERDSERDVRGKKETVMNSEFLKISFFFNNLSKKLDIYNFFLFRNVIEKTNKFNSAISKIKKIFRIFLFGLWRKCQTIKVEEDQVETRGKRRKKNRMKYNKRRTKRFHIELYKK